MVSRSWVDDVGADAALAPSGAVADTDGAATAANSEPSCDAQAAVPASTSATAIRKDLPSRDTHRPVRFIARPPPPLLRSRLDCLDRFASQRGQDLGYYLD